MPAPDQPHIRTVYLPDGTIKREVVGLKGDRCLEAVKPFNTHLPEGYAVTPTDEFYEDGVVEPEKDKETQ